jgi:TPR repeat protein
MTEGGALDQFRVLAEKGDPAAQFSLGARYATGDDVKQDYTEAVRWFSKAAEQGHIVSQATLGAYYWAGRGVPQDLGKAYFWSVLAETGGDEASKYRVQVLTSRMSRPQIIAAQQKANEWLQTRQASSALQKRSPAR